MRDQQVLRIIAKLVIPFILLFGFYVLMHGKYSPGGGFQAGVIIAAAFISYSLIYGAQNALKIISLVRMKQLAALGALTYGAVGIATLQMGGKLFEYNVLFEHPHTAQFWGIMIVEAGIGLTVAMVIMAIFFTFATFHPSRLDEEER